DRSVDHIRASSHTGCIKRPDTWLHPYRFAKGQILFPCTAGAVHTWHETDVPTCATHVWLLRESGPSTPAPQRVFHAKGYKGKNLHSSFVLLTTVKFFRGRTNNHSLRQKSSKRWMGLGPLYIWMPPSRRIFSNMLMRFSRGTCFRSMALR